MKRVAILYSEYSPLVDAIKYRLSDCDADVITSLSENNEYDLVVLAGFNGEYKGNALKCHHSLLPAFESDEPERDAILYGAKVTGVTIYYTNPKKIVAQYPVFIKSETHFDDLKQELEYIEQTLYPLVIEKILKNEPFDTEELLSKNSACCCSSTSCEGSCIGCNH